MKEPDRKTFLGCHNAYTVMISRRNAVGLSALAALRVLSGSALGRESAGEPGRSGPPKEILERMEQFRMFSERMRNAGSMEERTRIMEERSAWERARAVEGIKEQLGVSDNEWSVVKPRLEAVYNLVHPPQQFGRGDARSMAPVEQRSRELRELLANKEAKAEEIKAGLTALRAAKEQARQELVKARQNLRQVMTLRQEAVLVLNGLLD